ncbi:MULTISPECIES: class I adenylate-forming enzyme family protein [Streptomyces]|uniref:Fatty-acid--CoA ligase n=1 Tax=Streptomyces tsukubensis (strain DSM 42081 / NBRC 108919 / NRRL 18488 / 9993) TaxID=1114943 RepID=I2NA97_STRT9|nr:class I adenylate-forming enzyme family protein [Streptomyces tsukubensis]MYS62739.1 AMP-binding protein [Streptomyces sp. SID5473]AZK97756.1 fatty-acid--CoA ligase [Streptomyces tsukubensis]EIF93944.1 fatty-acid--CoA ligase [Streptomyces tsukubensis NRRL18488]QKM66316.1 fatty-acid--CoA ligase [Streptomyces tsukubensis NRRL18488]TAI45347.1 fatty-acid--CoA ligase [Streptomyces tsukubensis]
MTPARPPYPTSLPELPRVGADAFLTGSAGAYPERIALRDGAETLTYAELHDAALRVAGGLRARGLGPGDVVAMHLPNTLWYVVAYYGALCAGLTVAPLNPAQPPEALRSQLADCGARAVFTHPSAAVSAATAQVLTAAGPVIHVPGTAVSPAPDDTELPGTWIPLAALLAAAPLDGYRPDPDLVAHLQLTGGTTGRTKAVRVLHRNIVANVLQSVPLRSCSRFFLDENGGLRLERSADALDQSIVPGDCVNIAVAPLFHGLGLIGHNSNTLLGAVCVITGGRFDADRFLQDIESHGVTHISGSPAMYYAMLRSPELGRRDLSSVRMVTSGAAPIDPGALARLRAALPNAAVNEGYGLSEATMGVTMAAPGVRPPEGSVGSAVPGTELEIRAEDGTTVRPVGEAGEIWVRGPQVTDGYQDEPGLTAEQFVDGWLRTGDIGRLDTDGFLFLVGRAKDMLIYKGYNVYPQPLEDVLCSHPAVSQASVVGRPDPVAGEIPVAFVVLEPAARDRAAHSDAFIDELLAHVAERVAPYQRVREARLVDALPLTPTGKVLKTELRRRLDPAAGAC